MMRAVQLDQASALVVSGRNSETALQALKALTDLDAALAQIEREVPIEVTRDLESNEHLMTVAELLEALNNEGYGFYQVLMDILHGMRVYYREYPVTDNGLRIVLAARDNVHELDALARNLIDPIGAIAQSLLERDDKRRQLDDDDDGAIDEPLSPETRKRFEAIRAACAEDEEPTRGTRRELAAAE
jgi:hypothetical protein